jgi:hypothetical protein
MNPGEKVYLGDSVYAEFVQSDDDCYIKLTINNGYGDEHTIYLDPVVQVNLVKFIERIVEAA